VKFIDTEVEGLKILECEMIGDDRGYFSRVFCRDEFAEAGIDYSIVQCNISCNERRGTVRGMHWQAAPHGEAKLLACVAGRIFDVAVDLREGSRTYRQWFGIELDSQKPTMLFVPEGFAHGYMALTDGAMAAYPVNARYHPASARGFRPDDPAINIRWPMPIRVISEKDRSGPPLDA